jgi:hypothetical protein
MLLRWSQGAAPLKFLARRSLYARINILSQICNIQFKLGLTAQEKLDLVKYLKSL